MTATLLIIEDNLDLLQLLRELLQDSYRVVTAVNGEQGTALARAERPDLVLVDVELPGMDGVATALAIKAERAPEHLPVLVLTAHAAPGQEGRVRASGCCDDFLAKPAPLPEIRRRLEVLLAAAAAAYDGGVRAAHDSARLSGSST